MEPQDQPRWGGKYSPHHAVRRTSSLPLSSSMDQSLCGIPQNVPIDTLYHKVWDQRWKHMHTMLAWSYKEIPTPGIFFSTHPPSHLSQFLASTPHLWLVREALTPSFTYPGLRYIQWEQGVLISYLLWNLRTSHSLFNLVASVSQPRHGLSSSKKWLWNAYDALSLGD